MTTYSYIQRAARPLSGSQRHLEKLAPPAVATLCFAALAVAWLAFFTLVPFDLTPLR